MASKQFAVAKHTGVFCNATINPGYVFGVFHARYNYTTTANGLTVKTLTDDKIPYYITDYRPIYYALRYDGQYVPVYHVHIWTGEKWIETDTGSNRRYYKLAEFLQLQILRHGLYDKWTPEINSTPKFRSARPDAGKGKAVYGYMCKSPDRTITDYDSIGDTYAENRRFKK